MPLATASPLAAITMGTVAVTCLAASVPDVPCVTTPMHRRVTHGLGRERGKLIVFSLRPRKVDEHALALRLRSPERNASGRLPKLASESRFGVIRYRNAMSALRPLLSPDSDRIADAPRQCPNIGHVT